MLVFIKKGVESSEPKRRSYEQVINEIISSKINNLFDKKYIDKTKIDEAEMLLSIVDRMNKVEHLKDVVRPITPLSQSSLFTGTKNEPSLGSEIKEEIRSK